MLYSQVRSLISTGDVLACAGTWLFSKAIRWWTGDPVSHVGFAYWMQPDPFQEPRLCIFESMEPGGVRLIPLNVVIQDYWKKGGGIYWCKLREDSGINGKCCMGKALNYWGNAYDNWWQFVCIVSPGIRKFRTKIGLPMKVGNPSSFDCSELVTRCLIDEGLKWDKEPSYTTPGEVMRFNCFYEPIPLYPDSETEQYVYNTRVKFGKKPT